MTNGSTWNRWELHMHTPLTKKNDQFTVSPEEKEEYTKKRLQKNSTYQYNEIEHKWEKYIDKINEYVDADTPERNIKVIGVTDYYSIENYKHILSLKDKLSSNIMLLPNVELRLNMTGRRSPINIHCIFNPEIVDELHEKFFAQIKMTVGDSTYLATKKGFIDLGKDNSENKSLSDEYYEKQGIGQFTVEFSDFKKIFQNSKLRENTIIIVANSSNDGASGLRGQLDMARKDVYHFVDAIFSSTPSDIKFFSGETNSKVLEECGKLMPCFHGSDAHCYEDMFEPDEKRYCYIKSEISFDGLKQVLNDPQDRVFIGKKCDVLENIEKTKNRKIKSLSIKNSRKNTWFQNVCIEFNPQLNVIIGNKGNGKTAIGDILSFCGNVTPTKDFKFLSQFSKTEDAESIESNITFLDETSTDFVKLSNPPKQQTPSVKYIPQAYFETITNEVDKTEKLRKEIEGVIFDYLPSTIRGAYSSFSEYRESIEYEKQREIKCLCDSLIEINKKIIALENESSESYIERLKNDLKRLEKELSNHNLKKPEENLQNSTDDEREEENEILKWKKKLSIKQTIKRKLEGYVSRYIKEKDKINLINNELNQKVQDIQEYFNKHSQFLSGYDLEDILEIKYDNDNKIDSVSEDLQKKIDRINNYLSQPYLNIEQYAPNSFEGKIHFIKAQINNLEKEVSARTMSLVIEQEKIQNWEKRRIEIEGEKNNPKEGTIRYIKSKITYINKKLPKELKELCEQRLEITKSIVDCKLNILSELEEGTKELRDFLSENNGSILAIKSELYFNNDFIDKFLANINQQKNSSYRGRIEGREVLNNLVEKHFSDGITKDKIVQFLSDVDTTNKEYERKDRKVTSDLSFIKNRDELYNYLFSLDYISIEFNLKMGKKALDQLSPGERGAILLVFYLLLDKGDIPLIIDQPEDNLDNQSIADVLVPYIREAKRKRQIIMITHNPNLAVVSDAELVIHVEIDKENQNLFRYTSGGIENRKINNGIQDILEGTPKAFRIRDNKYFSC